MIVTKKAKIFRYKRDGAPFGHFFIAFDDRMGGDDVIVIPGSEYASVDNLAGDWSEANPTTQFEVPNCEYDPEEIEVIDKKKSTYYIRGTVADKVL